MIADVRTCAEASLPRLADRAMAEPLWVVTTALNVWTGQSAPESILGNTPQIWRAVGRERTCGKWVPRERGTDAKMRGEAQPLHLR